MAEEALNPTSAAVLGLLHEGPMTGGQLMAAASRRLGPFWSMTRSQVYRELPALADLGYVKLGRPGPRASQPYAITPAGKRAFLRWLAAPSGREQFRNQMALRMAFGTMHSAGQLADAYDEAIQHHTDLLAEAREAVKAAKKEGDTFGAAALEFAVGYHRSVLTWLRGAPRK